MWDGLKPKARAHRADATPGEAKLWTSPRGNRLAGLSFRRQHPLGRYIAGFFCTSQGVVIELDGPIHEVHRKHDAQRRRELERMGYLVLRFSNDRVLTSLQSVLDDIETACGERSRAGAAGRDARKRSPSAGSVRK